MDSPLLGVPSEADQGWQARLEVPWDDFYLKRSTRRRNSCVNLDSHIKGSPT